MRWVDCGKISRDLEEMMLERGLHVDHTTIYRWVQHYAPSAVSRGQVRADHAWRFISAVDSQGTPWSESWLKPDKQSCSLLILSS